MFPDWLFYLCVATCVYDLSGSWLAKRVTPWLLGLLAFYSIKALMAIGIVAPLLPTFPLFAFALFMLMALVGALALASELARLLAVHVIIRDKISEIVDTIIATLGEVGITVYEVNATWSGEFDAMTACSFAVLSDDPAASRAIVCDIIDREEDCTCTQ